MRSILHFKFESYFTSPVLFIKTAIVFKASTFCILCCYMSKAGGCIDEDAEVLSGSDQER